MKAKELADGVKGKSAAVIGCGGLGGWTAEMLARAALRKLVVCDGDVFTLSNGNRQLYCTQSTLNRNKAEVAAEKIRDIGLTDEVKAYGVFVTKENVKEIVEGVDVVFDCCDNVDTRLMIEEYCGEADILLVHGAINDVYGQVTVVYPRDNTLKKLYSHGAETTETTIACVPAFVASLQVALGMKALCGEGEKSLFVADVIDGTIDKLGE